MDSYDLEMEFQKLVAGMREKIEEKRQAGTLTEADAMDLNDLISDRLTAPREVESRGWQRSSWCGEMQDDEGWNSSGCTF
jgi:hypothetical protein